MPRKPTKKAPKKKVIKPKLRSLIAKPRSFSGDPLVTTTLAGIPDKVNVVLRYVEKQSVTSSSTPYLNQIFRINSLYDPDYTSGGHQPMYYDQYGAMYNYYRVKGATIKVQALNAGTLTGVDVTLVPAMTYTAFTTTSKMLEQNTAAVSRVSCINGTKPVFLKYNVNCAKHLGVSQATLEADDQYAANIGSNPEQPLYLHLHAEATNLVSDISVNYLWEIKFYCQFYGRKIMDQS